jgi:hypothetical protein
MALQMTGRVVENSDVLMRVYEECRQQDEAPYSSFPCREPAKVVQVWADVNAVLGPIDRLITQWSSSSSRPRFGHFFLEIFELERRNWAAPCVQDTVWSKGAQCCEGVYRSILGDRYDSAAVVLAAVLTPQYLVAGITSDQKEVAMRVSAKAWEYLQSMFPVLFPERWADLQDKHSEANDGAVLLVKDSVLFSQWHMYRNYALLKDTIKQDTNDLLWWRQHKDMFPDLYRFARVFLAIPLSSTTIERLWSKLKRVLTKARGGLDAELGAKQVWCHEFRLSMQRLEEAFSQGMIPAMEPRQPGDKISMQRLVQAYEKK